MAEFTLIVSVLLLLFFALVEFGMALNAQLVLTSAAREGVRRAAVDGGASQAAFLRARRQLELGNIDPAQCQIRIDPRRARHGEPIRIQIRYRYSWATPVVRAVAGDAIWLEAGAIGRSERLAE